MQLCNYHVHLITFSSGSSHAEKLTQGRRELMTPKQEQLASTDRNRHWPGNNGGYMPSSLGNRSIPVVRQ